MSDPERDGAQVGDMIEITCERTPLFGDRFIVVPVPEKTLAMQEKGDAWIDRDGHIVFVRFQYYKIIKASQKTKSVDIFLQKQLDDNLGSIFG